jgi:hypothetical protein
MVNPDLRYIVLCAERDEAERAYMAEIKAAPPVRERSREQQQVIDRLLGIRQEASRKVWHYGVL